MPDTVAEARAMELELVLRDLLYNFDVGPEGTTVESSDGGIVVVGIDVEQAIERATDVLEREE